MRILLLIFLCLTQLYANEKILADYKNRVSNKFEITPFYRDSVLFWYKVYTQYSKHTHVIHDKKNPALIYGSTKKPKAFKKKTIKRLKALAKNSKSYPGLYKKISQMTKVPKKNESKFFSSLVKNIRSQKGQKDFIYNGLLRFSDYEYFLTREIKKQKLPVELLAIPFIESSFNPIAGSKAGAAGPWQFMRLIASYFLPRRNKNIDYRYNTILSSLAGFHLLKQNKQILKSYDLAITAYNSGTKNLIAAQRKYGKQVNLEFIIDNHKGDSFGFASKNFYSEFLALTRVLAYKNEIFEDIPKSKKIDYKVYLSKCTIKPNFIFKSVKTTDLEKSNLHFLKPWLRYPKGSLVVSSRNLTKRKYKKVSERIIRKYYPKSFRKKYKLKCL